MTTTPTPRIWTLVHETLSSKRSELARNVAHLRTVVAADELHPLDPETVIESVRSLVVEQHARRTAETKSALSKQEIYLSELDDALAYFVAEPEVVACWHCTEKEEAEASTLPADWRRLSTSTLEGFAENSGEEPFLTDADYDDVLDELAGRYESEKDPRVAQGTGNAFGEVPS